MNMKKIRKKEKKKKKYFLYCTKNCSKHKSRRSFGSRAQFAPILTAAGCMGTLIEGTSIKEKLHGDQPKRRDNVGLGLHGDTYKRNVNQGKATW
jgi:hypothetical protein